MGKVQEKARFRKGSRGSGGVRRFLTSRDMAIIKLDESIKNSQIKRGEREKKGNADIRICGCGVEGCFLHLEFDGNPYRSHFDYK